VPSRRHHCRAGGDAHHAACRLHGVVSRCGMVDE
jgi:hypothetical protein